MPNDDVVGSGLAVSRLSLAWTMAASSASIAIGVARGSLVLVAFGVTGLLDSVGSATLVLHFRHALRHETFSERRERVALEIVTIGLVVVGLATAAESVRRLIGHAHPRSAPEGIVLAAASAVVLWMLASRKRDVGGRVPSDALVADGWVSTTGALLAAVTVCGTAFNAAFGWHWVDALASLVVASGAVVLAVELRRE